MPAVALFSKPKGAPIASTHSPTLRLRESPVFTTGRSLALILITAISDLVSTPMTLAVYSRRSVMRTVTSLAPFTTWALVRMTPSLLMMKPEPSPRTGAGLPWKGWPRKKGAKGLFGPKGFGWAPGPWPLSSSESSSSPCSTAGVALVTTAMFTTAGPQRCTIAEKSGSWAARFTAGAAGVGWVGVVLGVATAEVAPATYSTLTGAAIAAAPRSAATIGFFTRFGRFIDTQAPYKRWGPAGGATGRTIG